MKNYEKDYQFLWSALNAELDHQLQLEDEMDEIEKTSETTYEMVTRMRKLEIALGNSIERAMNIERLINECQLSNQF